MGGSVENRRDSYCNLEMSAKDGVLGWSQTVSLGASRLPNGTVSKFPKLVLNVRCS